MPQFNAGAAKTAKITLTNPKAKATDYNGMLFMGADMVLKAEASFSLNANQSKEVLFSVVMPNVAGTYPVYIGAFSDNALIPPYYRGREDVTVKVPSNVVQLPYYFKVLGIEGIPFSEVTMEPLYSVEDYANWLHVWDCFCLMGQPCSPYGPRCFTNHAALARATYNDYLRIYDLIVDYYWTMETYPIQVGELERYIIGEIAPAMIAVLEAHPEYIADTCKYGSLEDIASRCIYSLVESYPPRMEHVATLSEPIVMDTLRGVTVNCLYEHMGYSWAVAGGTAYLQFPIELGNPSGPPGFRGNWGFGSASDGKEVSINITTCFAAGYSYPGVYHGRIDLGGGGDGRFIVKNLAKVTEEGTVALG